MDRDLIQRQDFPTGRRGYDIAAVDDHLRRVADAFETNTAMPAQFLMQQMELREALMDARSEGDHARVTALAADVHLAQCYVRYWASGYYFRPSQGTSPPAFE